MTLVGAERVLVAVDVDPDLAAVGHHLGDVGGVERLDRGGDLRHALAEARAERAVVGLDRVADQVGLLGDEVELLDVELGGDEVGAGLDRLALGVVGDDHGAAQRLAHLRLRLGAGGAAELDREADRLHRRLELGVGERRVGLGEVAQVDRVGQLAELLGLAAGEVEVDLVGEEGGEGREQRRGLQQAVAQGREGGPVAVPEAAAREPHVPVGELLDVLGDRPAGGGAVEVVHPLADRRDVACSRESAQRSRSLRARASWPRSTSAKSAGPRPSAFA